jgi:anoctamin-10
MVAKEKAEAEFTKLVKGLAAVGLDVEARDGGENSVFVFVKVANEDHLKGEVYRTR